MSELHIYNFSNTMPEHKFEEMYSLLCEAFPPSELRSRRGHLKEFESPHFNCMTCESDGLIALMNFWEIDDFIFLEHFAVSTSQRGHGLGSQLIRELYKLADGSRVILEAEPPESDSIAKRRVDFYIRNGFYLNEYEYWQPALQSDEKPIKLNIMSSLSPLNCEEFNETKRLIYKYVYNIDI